MSEQGTFDRGEDDRLLVWNCQSQIQSPFSGIISYQLRFESAISRTKAGLANARIRRLTGSKSMGDNLQMITTSPPSLLSMTILRSHCQLNPIDRWLRYPSDCEIWIPQS